MIFPAGAPRLIKGYATVLIGIALLAGAAGCATRTKVHLFTEGLTAAEVKRLETSLDRHGYRAVLNSLPVPEGIVVPTIVYSPLHKDLGRVEALRDLMAGLGYPLDLQPISSGNHFYTSINVGLYLAPHDPATTGGPTLLDAELFGECPAVDAELALRPDLTFSLEIWEWDEARSEEVTSRRAGTWRRLGDTVFLAMGDTEIPFSVSRFQRDTDYARMEGIRLRNETESKLVKQCDFVYRLLDPW